MQNNQEIYAEFDAIEKAENRILKAMFAFASVLVLISLYLI